MFDLKRNRKVWPVEWALDPRVSAGSSLAARWQPAGHRRWLPWGLPLQLDDRCSWPLPSRCSGRYSGSCSWPLAPIAATCMILASAILTSLWQSLAVPSGPHATRARGADAGESLGERLHLFTHIDAHLWSAAGRHDARPFGLQAGPSAREHRDPAYSSWRGAAQVSDTPKKGL